VTYILYAFLKDWRNGTPAIEEVGAAQRNNIEPHSEEEKTETTETQQNVTFSDVNSGHMVDYTAWDDPLRTQPLNVDATLDNFFSRPLKIFERQWSVGASLYFRINPWELYFRNTRVINRIANYKLMRADLHIKIILNGNAFHYGRCIVSYNPLHTQDQMTVNRPFIEADVVAASQRPHIWLNPTTSEGGEMKLPFFYYKNLIDIVAQEWDQMGELVAHSLQNLKHANGANDDVTISVFAWAENVQFSIPTQVEPGSIAPQALEIQPHTDEYGTKPVSRIAGAVAKMAGHLTKIPVIGPFARATEIGSQAVGAIATLFGYSSPVVTEMSVYRPVPKTNLANTNVDNDANKLSLDIKQELSCDPRTVGLGPDDQMTISHVAQKESYLAEYPWNIGAAPETLLWQCVVDPSVHRNVLGERHFPAPAFAVMPFKYWRGSMRFRFMIVSSGYHKGRLKIVYDPEGGIGTAEYNTAYTTIVDISEETDFTIDVGWGQATTWRQHRGLDYSTPLHGTNSLGYTSSTVNYGNGTISVYVVNELTVPNSTINNDIDVNVFVRMLDDFEVCVPTQEHIRQLRLREFSIPPSGSQDIEPQANEQEKIAPTKDISVTHMANKIPINDPTSLFHFGEAVGSFRQILKRYSIYEYLPPPTEGAGYFMSTFTRPHIPLLPGYTAHPVSNGPPNLTLSAGEYTCVFMTPVRYVSSAYAAMRGGMRYAFDASPKLTTNSRNINGIITRHKNFKNANNDVEPVPTNVGTGLAELCNLVRDSFDGAAMMAVGVNPVLSAELPYYSEYRFIPAKKTDTTLQSSVDKFSSSWCLQLQEKTSNTNNQWCPLYNAAAEDFTCFWYLGPPIFFVETEYPIS
jgi:hypothetical protein